MSMLYIQLIGFAALVLSLVTYQFNKRSTMLWIDLIAASLYAVHFFLLGASTGGAMNLIGATRSAAYYKFPPSKKHTWVFVLFFCLACIATAIFWQGPLSLLALGGTLAYGIAYWQGNPTHIRRFLVLSFPLWFAYNVISGSYPGMIVEVIMLCSNLVGQYRFDYKRSTAYWPDSGSMPAIRRIRDGDTMGS